MKKTTLMKTASAVLFGAMSATSSVAALAATPVEETRVEAVETVEASRVTFAADRQFIWDQNHSFYNNPPLTYYGQTLILAEYKYNPYSGLYYVLATYR